MRKKIIFAVVIGILTVLWLSAERRIYVLEREYDLLYSNNVEIEAIDAETKKTVPMIFKGPLQSTQYRWPKRIRFKVGDSGMSVRFGWESIGPIKVEVSAAGYQTAEITLDSDSPPNVFVPLRYEVSKMGTPLLPTQ